MGARADFRPDYDYSVQQVERRSADLVRKQRTLKMALSNWWFATVFVIALLGCVSVLLIVWYRRPKQDG